MHKQWKVIELKIARYLGGDRNPITGRTRNQGTPDIGKAKEPLESLPDADAFISCPNYQDILKGAIFDCYTFEIKHRKLLPKWLVELQIIATKQGVHIQFSDFLLTTLYNFRNSVFLGKLNLMPAEQEVKLPEWILDAKDQAEQTGKTPYYVVVLHGKNQKIRDSIVLIFEGNK